MTTIERIAYLRGIHFPSDAAFERALNLKPKTVDSWKRNNSQEYMKMIPEIAVALRTSSLYLLCVTDDPTPSSEESPADIEPVELLRQYVIATIGREPTQRELLKLKDFIETYAKGLDK